MSHRTLIGAMLSLLALGGTAQAGGNVCGGPGDFPDVIVGDLSGIQQYGSVGDMTAFSVGTTSCNIGTCWLNWFQGPSNQHPVIGQNLYRLKDGRFEQLGQSWLKHGFFALSQGLCFSDCQGTNGDHLGVHCSDPYSAPRNGSQSNLGPKFEVNVTTGVHPHPVTDGSLSGDAIYKRLQVHNDDLNPDLNAGAQYFVEGHYVAADDAAAGKQNNNASYRPVVVTGSNGNYNLQLTGSTVREKAAIQAWAANDPEVVDAFVDVPQDGRFILAAKVTDLGGGQWRYEYALHNLSSHRSAMSFSVPVPAGSQLANIGFHDVDYHSGEPYHGADWQHNGGAGGVLTWTTGQNGSENPDANALRWGTLYNFRFDCTRPPTDSPPVTLGLYRVGTPSSVTARSYVPTPCNDDGVCDAGETCSLCPGDCLDGVCEAVESACSCPQDCGEPAGGETDCDDGIDNDCDGLVDCPDPECCNPTTCPGDEDNDGVLACADCDDQSSAVWSIPAEIVDVEYGPGPWLSWTPVAPGGLGVATYEVLRSTAVDNFVEGTICLAPAVPSQPQVTDFETPPVGSLFAYLVRALNACPGGASPLGDGAEDQPREGRFCQ